MEIEFIPSLANVSADQWNAMWPGHHPFTRYEYLWALENSGSANAASGWQAHHALAWHEGRLLAAIPLYIKNHSYGEYVFDWSWANAYQDHGYHYYPKLVNAIPFTPASGPRWGIAQHLSSPATIALIHELSERLIRETTKLGCSGCHCLFPDYRLLPHVKRDDWLQRYDCQYHWFNQNFADFGVYLQTFASRKRKNIRKERDKIQQQKIRIEMTPGANLSKDDWRYFSHLYQRTYLKRSGHEGYLKPSFFTEIGKTLQNNITMARAFIDTQWIAAALYFYDDTTLYGRYWGSIDDVDALHFECCYYSGIEFAIQNKLHRFDPGAQGEHKVARGFQPVFTASLHHIEHPGFNQAIADFITREKAQVALHCAELREQLPFKEGIPLTPEDCILTRA